MNPIISIIIPVYNTGEYLCKCLDSIVDQTFNAYECILIDDGSLDNSPLICDEYSKRDKRFVVIHQLNSGVSLARNAGLDIAKGEWILFVDSDDWCDKEMVQFLYCQAKENNADVSICGKRDIYGVRLPECKKQTIHKYIFNGQEACKALFSESMFNTSPWGRLIKADFFFKEKIRFDPSIDYSEDALLLFKIFKNVSKVVYCDSPYYNYFHSQKSITNSGKLTKKTATLFLAYEKILSDPQSKIYKNHIMARLGIETYYLLLHYYRTNDFTSEAYKFLKTKMRSCILYIIFSRDIKNKKKKVCFLMIYPQFRQLGQKVMKVICLFKHMQGK
jgi:glycosyltransferase involved in cell wall biosynthesis